MAGETTVRTLRVQSEERGTAEVAAKLEKLAGAAAKADAAVDKYAAEAKKGILPINEALAKAQKDVSKATLSQAKAVQSLQRRIDPTYRALNDYEKAQKRVNLAVDQGAITQEKAQSILAGYEARYVSAATASKKMVHGLKSVNDNARLSSFQMLNLSRQGNDVITMFALGANPMQIFASQAGQVYDALSAENGLAAGFKALGNSAKAGLARVVAFGASLGPVGLSITAAVAGLGGLAYYLSRTGYQAKSAEEILKEFKSVVDEIGNASEASRKKIKAMLDQPESWSGIRADAKRVSDDIGKNLAAKIAEVTDRMQAFITPWKDLSPAVLEAQQHIRDLSAGLETGRLTASQVYDELNRMANVDTYPSSLADTINDLREIIKQARTAQRQLQALKTFANVDVEKGARPGTMADLDARLNMQERFGNRDLTGLADRLRSQAADMKSRSAHIASTAGDSIGSAAKSAIDPWKGLRKAVTDTSTKMSEAAQTAKGFLSTFTSDLEQGKSAWQAFGDAATSALDRIIDKTENQLVNALFPSGGGGLLSLLGLGGGASNIWSGAGGGFAAIGTNANGTNNWRGGPTWVGELGPEIVNLPRGAQVVPNHRIRTAANQNGGYSDNRVYNIDARGAQQGVGEEIKRALAAYDAQVAPNTAKRAVNESYSAGNNLGAL